MPIAIATKAMVSAQPCQLIGMPRPETVALRREPFGLSSFIVFSFGGRPRLRGDGRLQLHAARAERLAQQAFDLGIDAPKVGRGAALDRRPKARDRRAADRPCARRRARRPTYW